jgi:RNA polymerase sigma-70 factor, ECF subfamily
MKRENMRMKPKNGDDLDSEREIIKRAKKNIGDFDMLYEMYFPKINNFVYHRVYDDAVKNEIVSNVFFKAMKKLNLFRFLDSKKCTFSSWLYRIAVNEINQYFRDRKRDRTLVDKFINKQPDKGDPVIDFKIVKQKMTVLSTEEQNLIALKYFEKLKHKEISEIYKISESNVKVRLHRAMKKLRYELKDEVSYGKVG